MQIGDKTLLAWVHPANLDQRAGSALTIQDLGEFDAIVLSEVRPQTWMRSDCGLQEIHDASTVSGCFFTTNGCRICLGRVGVMAF